MMEVGFVLGRRREAEPECKVGRGAHACGSNSDRVVAEHGDRVEDAVPRQKADGFIFLEWPSGKEAKASIAMR
jgi:hypothetical protein